MLVGADVLILRVTCWAWWVGGHWKPPQINDLVKLWVVNEVGPVSMDEGTESKAIFPASQHRGEERGLMERPECLLGETPAVPVWCHVPKGPCSSPMSDTNGPRWFRLVLCKYTSISFPPSFPFWAGPALLRTLPLSTLCWHRKQ